LRLPTSSDQCKQVSPHGLVGPRRSNRSPTFRLLAYTTRLGPYHNTAWPLFGPNILRADVFKQRLELIDLFTRFRFNPE